MSAYATTIFSLQTATFELDDQVYYYQKNNNEACFETLNSKNICKIDIFKTSSTLVQASLKAA